MNDLKSIIDEFVSFLILENCEGCTECEPRIDDDFFPNFACVEQGRAKWLMDEGKRFIAKKGAERDHERVS